VLTARELHQRGLDATNEGKHAQARRILRRAMSAQPTSEDLARILVTLAHVESELGSASDGLALCDQALELPDVPAPVAGLVHSQRALLLMRAGEGNAALEEFRTAQAMLDDTPTPLLRLHLNRGMVHLQRADAELAMSDFAAAVDWARKAGAPVPLAKAEFNLGYTHLLTGELATALRLMTAAQPVLDPLSPATRAVNEQDRAEVLLAAGMTRDAAESLRHAAAAFGSRRLSQRQGEAEFVLARLLLNESPVEARKVALRAQRRFARRGSVVWSHRAHALALASDLQRGRRVDQTVQAATEVSATLRQHGLTHDALRLDLETVRSLVRRGHVDAARDALARIRITKQTQLGNRLLARMARSELAAAQHRRSAALTHARRGLADLHDWQSSFGSLDLQSSLVGHGRQLALKGMSLAVDDGRPEVIFEWSERARTLASRVTPVRPPSDAGAASELTRLRALQNDLTSAESRGRPTAALQRKVTELRQQIRQRQWYASGSGEVIEPASIAEVAAALGARDDALVAYLGVDDRLVALTLTGDRAETHDLGGLTGIRQLLAGMQADLDMSATRLPAMLRATVHDSLRSRLDDLDDLLVRPLADDLGARRLVVVPSGSLAGVPWTLLPGLFGRPLTVPRSASSWLASRGSAAAPQSAGFVAGPHVDRATEEIQAAAKTWSKASVLLADDADAAHVTQLANDVDVFHVAALGRHSSDNPLFSGLELVDGPWFGYDIDQLASNPPTVVLSACELGRSSVRWGEETIGMTVAWLHAGAQTVVASPASVDDDVACYTLAATHHYLAAGRPPAEALAEAMVEIGGPVPAPFVCFGSGW
jgi:tetratricopeptide (TPR) repeat protein